MKEMQALYKEKYRNQFHYSMPVGWMNDINGLWYVDGVYHMTFQHNLDLKAWSHNFCVGHAYSPDLVHWYSAPIALIENKQMKGHIWSGTAMVDVTGRAGFGENAVILANTACDCGNSIAVSTDGGWEFKGIAENPVVALPKIEKELDPPVVQADLRDPKIFWLESEQCYVMILYWYRFGELEEKGKKEGVMDFYSSKDLKTWEHFQRFRKCDVISDLESKGMDTEHVEQSLEYIHECPNMFPMECDGETYWVFHGGDSRYVIGKFEGLHYTVLEAPLEPMSFGPDIYAGQTFENLDRRVCIFWMDNWGGSTVKTYPWRNGATIAGELELKRCTEGLRLYRNPVSELEMLRIDTKEADEISNYFAPEEWKAPIYDAEVVIDWAKTTAQSIVMSIGEKQYVICEDVRTFYSEYVNQQHGLQETEFCFGQDELLKLRILVDRDSVEMFFQDGRYSYTEEFGFETEILGFEMKAEDGGLIAVSGKFHPLKSIWE